MTAAEKAKRLIIVPIVALELALVIAVGSQTFLGACVHDDGGFGPCHWASRAVLGLGAAQAVMAVMALLWPERRQGIFLAMLPVSVLGFFTPGGLIDICRMNTMRCRMVMRPAMLVLFALTLALALAGCLTSRRRKA